MSQEVMTVEEVAKYLSISPETVYDKVGTHDMPYMKLGNLLRFPKETIDEWLRKETVPPVPRFYDEVARAASRWLFHQWLISRGIDPDKVDEATLHKASEVALEDLKLNPNPKVIP